MKRVPEPESRPDPDEIYAVRDNLGACDRAGMGPPGRFLPESLCVEIDQLLQLYEAEIRAWSTISELE